MSVLPKYMYVLCLCVCVCVFMCMDGCVMLGFIQDFLLVGGQKFNLSVRPCALVDFDNILNILRRKIVVFYCRINFLFISPCIQ